MKVLIILLSIFSLSSYGLNSIINKDPYLFVNVDNQINEDVMNGFPGAVLVIVKNGQVIKKDAYGYKLRYDQSGNQLPDPESMTTDTIFDLASNTKMYVTNYAVMKLVSQGLLDIDKPISYYLPQYIGCDSKTPSQCRDTRLVKDLLWHSAGYMPDPQFFNPQTIKQYGDDLYSQNRQQTILDIITKLPFVDTRGGAPIYQGCSKIKS